MLPKDSINSMGANVADFADDEESNYSFGSDPEFWEEVTRLEDKKLRSQDNQSKDEPLPKKHRQVRREQGSSSRYNPSINRFSFPPPSTSPTVSETIQAKASMSKVPFFSTGAHHQLSSLPITPKKPKAHEVQATPATERTKAARVLERLTLSSPNKKQTIPKFPDLSKSGPVFQPRETMFTETDSDEDEECQVNDMLVGSRDSAPPTRSNSLFEFNPSQEANTTLTPASSWSLRSRQESWTSAEAHSVSGNKRKRYQTGEITEDNINRTAGSPLKLRVVDDVFTTPKTSEPKMTKPEITRFEPAKDSVAPPTMIPSAVSNISHSVMGVELQPVIIAHSRDIQDLFDKHNIAWGVQYEFARGVTHKQWTWDDVREKMQCNIGEFRGVNAHAAYKVFSIMRNRPAREDNRSLWQELDREEAAILENKGRGLGLMGLWYDQEDWFGGRIQQIARLSKEYKIQLEPLEKRRSHRFARYCGSRRILQLRIHQDLILKDNAKLKTFLKKKFVLCGRIFVPFHAKDHALYMVEINENWERRPRVECGDQFRLSFSDFVNWHNPLENNYKQAMSKYVTRFALGLSTSVPVVEFESENISFIDDTYSSNYDGGKAAAEQIMTDGCGFINQAALIAINAKLNKQSLPVAVQGRIGGAKGLWLLHFSDNSPEYKIWIRDSQSKVKLPRLDRAHRIFELLATSQPATPISISTQSIVNLSFNGVPDNVLTAYLEHGLEEEVTPLVDWDQPKALVHLWHAIHTTGRVGRARLARVTAGISRALGLTGRVWKEVEDDVDADEADIFNEESSAFTGRNQYSRAPVSLNEFALELVQAGFHPAQSTILQNKIKYIIESTIKTYVEKYRIPLSESLDGFVVPDPLDILEEGQIYYRSSQTLVDPRTQKTFNILTGEVILGRYPIRLASDLQKVTAVDIPKLYDWPDVIITSTKGVRSLASLLSGGDMDGDELFILREPEIVEPFKNHPFVPPPDDLVEANFRKDVETVNEFCHRIQGLAGTARQEAFQEALLLSLNDDQKGLYSKFHDNAIEKYGYNDPRAIRLGYLFNTLLDASKSGLRLKPGIFEKDCKEFGSYCQPFDFSPFVDRRSPTKHCKPSAEEPSTFILAKLRTAAQLKGEDLMQRYNTVARSNIPCDKDLIKPYEDAVNFAHWVYDEMKNSGNRKVFTENLGRIRDHVERAHTLWAEECANSRSSASKKNGKQKSSKDVASVAAAQHFASEIRGLILPPVWDIEKIKASYAYRAWPESPFAFQVAFKQLCEIKAACLDSAPCIREIDELKTIAASSMKAFKKSFFV